MHCMSLQDRRRPELIQISCIVLAQSLRIANKRLKIGTSRSISSAPDDRKQALSGRLFLK